MKYHVNPSTGRVGQCRAKSPETCEFSKSAGVVIQHYDTSDEAKKAYETLNSQKTITKPIKKSKKNTAKDIEDFNTKKETGKKFKKT